MYIPVKCAFCGGKPELEHKWRGYRYVCNNPLCAGHHGRYHMVEGGAARMWNNSQSSKRSTGRRFMLTRQINQMGAYA
jgi:hypothetical protein